MNSKNWQTRHSHVRARNSYAFYHSLLSDVEFLVSGKGRKKVKVPSNKYVLALTSPVFEAMFYGGLAETKSTIDLPDCTKEGLYEMLRYAHCDEVWLTGSNVMEVLYLAKKYIMPHLEERCKMFLQKEASPEDVFSILPQVQAVDDKELRNHLWGILDDETQQSISSEPFLNVSREMLCQVLKRDTLKVNELHLFQAVDKWAAKRVKEQGLACNGENKRAILGEEFVRMIRFPLITQKEFDEIVVPCGILNAEELSDLNDFFMKSTAATEMFSGREGKLLARIFSGRESALAAKLFRGKESATVQSTKLFNGKERFVLGEVFTPSCRFNGIYVGAWFYRFDLTDAIDFSVNKNVLLLGVRLFGSYESKYDVDLKLFKDNEYNCISEVTSSCTVEEESTDDKYFGFNVMFLKPIKLLPKAVYTAKAAIDGPPSFHGELGREVVTDGDIKITYSNARFNRTTIKRGQFPTLVMQKYL